MTSLAEWDAKHRIHEGPPAEPAEIVRELLPLLPHGPVLDLACGTGRNTLLLAARRQPVTAVDGSVVAQEILEQRSHDVKIPVSRAQANGNVGASRKGILAVQADLERAHLVPRSFSVILCVNYLQRSLFREMENALAPGGMLLFETYTRAQLELEGGPRSPEHLLRPGELRTAFPGLEIVFYRELRAGKGIASLLARKS